MSKAAELAALIGSQTALSNRNLIINGAMQVAQRGTSKSNPSGGYDTVDRFRVEGRTGQGGASTATQESFTPAASYPALLKNYFQLAITATPSSNPMHIEQRIEDCVTLNGQKVTLSFWGKVTSGTYDVTTNYENNSGGSGGTVQGSSAHTLTTTWTRFTETVTLPTVSSGTTGSSTYLKVQILFPIASGTNTVQITGVQLEVGEQATPFEHEPFETTEKKCFRYFQRRSNSSGYSIMASGGHWVNATTPKVPVLLHPRMRAAPTFSSAGSIHYVYGAGFLAAETGTPTLSDNTTGWSGLINGTTASVGTTGDHARIQTNNAAGNIDFDAEL